MSTHTTTGTESPERRQAEIISEGLPLGALRWYPHHSWHDGSTNRVDGYLMSGGPAHPMQLDVACLGDECCVGVRGLDATPTWRAGSVRVLTPGQELESDDVVTLVVPELALTTDLIVEALRRFRP